MFAVKGTQELILNYSTYKNSSQRPFTQFGVDFLSVPPILISLWK